MDHPARVVEETVLLPERFGQDFTEGVKARGREYFRGGEVRILRADARGILARVRGQALYKVEFDFYEDGDWQGECSCPFNQDRLEPCKHMWATLLEAAAQGRLAGAQAAERPVARSGGPEKSVDVPKWKRVLMDVREQMLEQQRRRAGAVVGAGAGAGAGKTQSNSWEERRLIYLIDAAQTISRATGITIEIGTERLRNGRWERLRVVGEQLLGRTCHRSLRPASYGCHCGSLQIADRALR